MKTGSKQPKKVKQAALKMRKEEVLQRRAELEQKQQFIGANITCWQQKVLPIWDKARYSPMVKQLCLNGIPSSLRSQVWPLLIDNELQIPDDMFVSLAIVARQDETLSELGSAQIQSPSIKLESFNPQTPTLLDTEMETALKTNAVDTLPEQSYLRSHIRSAATFPTLDSDDKKIIAHSPIDELLQSDYQTVFAHSRTRSYSAGCLSLSSRLSAESPITTPALNSNRSPRSAIATDVVCETKHEFALPLPLSEVKKQSRNSGDRIGTDPSVWNQKAQARWSSLRLIARDVPRTFPELAFFHDNGPMEESLVRVLRTYVLFQPRVGYVQGMSYIASLLLLYLDESAAFTCFANLLRKRGDDLFHRLDKRALDAYVLCFDHFFKRLLPLLYMHLRAEGVSSEYFLLDWYLTLFAKALPLEVATRLWDAYLFEPCGDPSDAFLARASLGLLRLLAPRLCTLGLEGIMALLIRVPEDLDPEALLSNIRAIPLSAAQFRQTREIHHYGQPIQSATAESAEPDGLSSGSSSSRTFSTAVSGLTTGFSRAVRQVLVKGSSSSSQSDSTRPTKNAHEQNYLADTPSSSAANINRTDPIDRKKVSHSAQTTQRQPAPTIQFVTPAAPLPSADVFPSHGRNWSRIKSSFRPNRTFSESGNTSDGTAVTREKNNAVADKELLPRVSTPWPQSVKDFQNSDKDNSSDCSVS